MTDVVVVPVATPDHALPRLVERPDLGPDTYTYVAPGEKVPAQLADHAVVAAGAGWADYEGGAGD